VRVWPVDKVCDTPAAYPCPPLAGTRSFVTTHWSVVLTAGKPESPQAAEALEKLCRAYWYPLYAYLRRRGCGPEDAEDGTPSFHVSPDKLFERRWATTVLEEAWTRLEAEYAAEGKVDTFRELRRFNSAQESGPGYAEAAGNLELPENTVKSLVHRMRRRYRTLLRAQIAHTVVDPAEIDEEIRHLLRVFGS